jgi:hypothetical protein
MSDDPVTDAEDGVISGARALIDSHVHLHDGFACGAFLDAAAANFARAARRLGLQCVPTGCLMLVESRGVNHFAALADGTAPTGAWRIEPTDEPVSLVAHRNDRAPVVVIAGRQIVCREGLEVLALGTRATFADGQALHHTLGLVVAEGALPVVPWGVGKWQGKRGRLIAELLERDRDRPLFVGDNGGRMRLAPRPRLFARAEQKHIPVLAGSDPLPLPHQLAKVGGYGFMAEVTLDENMPFATLRGYLESLDTSPNTFGRLESLSGFLRSQVTMQIRKHYRPWAQ